MGELIGSFLGSLLWVWLFSKLVARFGINPAASVWWGYVITLITAAVVSGYTGFPASSIALYGVFGLGWALFLSRRRSRRISKITDAGAVCPSCYQENDADADFCVRCGDELVDLKACPDCGEDNEPTAAFCKRCGSGFAEQNRAPRREPEKRADFDCMDCGAHLRFGASHCGECGLDFEYTDGKPTPVE